MGVTKLRSFQRTGKNPGKITVESYLKIAHASLDDIREALQEPMPKKQEARVLLPLLRSVKNTGYTLLKGYHPGDNMADQETQLLETLHQLDTYEVHLRGLPKLLQIPNT